MASALSAIALGVAITVLLSSGPGPRAHRLRTPTIAAAGAGPPAQPAPASEQFGANVNLLFNSGSETQQQIDAQLQALRRTGATLARSDAFWEGAEPAPPVDGVHG